MLRCRSIYLCFLELITVCRKTVNIKCQNTKVEEDCLPLTIGFLGPKYLNILLTGLNFRLIFLDLMILTSVFLEDLL